MSKVWKSEKDGGSDKGRSDSYAKKERGGKDSSNERSSYRGRDSKDSSSESVRGRSPKPFSENRDERRGPSQSSRFEDKPFKKRDSEGGYKGKDSNRDERPRNSRPYSDNRDDSKKPFNPRASAYKKDEKRNEKTYQSREYKKSDSDRSRDSRPARPYSDNKNENRKPFDSNRSSDRPFKREEGGYEKREFKKPYDSNRSSDRPYKREEGGSDKREFKKPYDSNRSSDRPYKREEGGSENREFKKPYDSNRNSDRPYKREEGGSDKREFKKPYDSNRSSDRPYKREEGGSDKPSFNKEDKTYEKRDFKKRESDYPRDENPRFSKRRTDTREEESKEFTPRARPNNQDEENEPGNFPIRFEAEHFDDEGNLKPRRKKGEEPIFEDIRKDESKIKARKKSTNLSRNEDIFPLRLNKFISNAGVCSRRDADLLIEEGKVKVNGLVVKELGIKIERNDVVEYSGKTLSLEKLVYILLNKPKDTITTTVDPEGRKTVMDLVGHVTHERILPVGRLDRNTTGLLLLTNDGELAQKLTHPSNKISKVYHVMLDRDLTKNHYNEIMEGIELEDGIALVDELAYPNPDDKRELGIEIHQGKNRIVRRIFEHFEYKVDKLDRVVYAGLTKLNLPRGKWRFLTPLEIRLMKTSKAL